MKVVIEVMRELYSLEEMSKLVLKGDYEEAKKIAICIELLNEIEDRYNETIK